MSGYLVFEKSPSRTSNWALVKVVRSRLCFLGLPLSEKEKRKRENVDYYSCRKEKRKFHCFLFSLDAMNKLIVTEKIRSNNWEKSFFFFNLKWNKWWGKFILGWLARVLPRHENSLTFFHPSSSSTPTYSKVTREFWEVSPDPWLTFDRVSFRYNRHGIPRVKVYDSVLNYLEAGDKLYVTIDIYANFRPKTSFSTFFSKLSFISRSSDLAHELGVRSLKNR